MANPYDRGGNDNTLGKNHLSNTLPDAHQSFRVLDTFIARMAAYRVDEARKAAKKRLTHTYPSSFEIRDSFRSSRPGAESRPLNPTQSLPLDIFTMNHPAFLLSTEESSSL